MDKAQVRHVRAMAMKIQTHLQAISWRVNALLDDDVKDISVERAKESLREIEQLWKEVESVIRDMEPEL